METARLLVCVDGSRASLEAARAAVQLARRWGSSLRAVYVVEKTDVDGSEGEVRTARMQAAGAAFLARIVAIGAAEGVHVEQALLEGVPFDAILTEARRTKADVIVMGRTGRTGPGRALLGSEAERVLEFSDRPVLIVPTIEAEPAPPPARRAGARV